MAGFTIGLGAAVLWLAVIVGVGYFVRHSTGSPLKTIRRFHLTRHSLKQLPEAGPDRPEPAKQAARSSIGDRPKKNDAPKAKRSRPKRKEAGMEFPLKARPEASARLAEPGPRGNEPARGESDSLMELFRRPEQAPDLDQPPGSVQTDLGPEPVLQGPGSDYPLGDTSLSRTPEAPRLFNDDELQALVKSISEVPVPQDSTVEIGPSSNGDAPAAQAPPVETPVLPKEPSPAEPKAKPVPKRRDEFALKAGKLTYFLVDDEGRLVKSRGSNKAS